MAQRMEALDELLRDRPCFTLRNLAVNGSDLTALGLHGPAVGRALAGLLAAVMEGRLANEKDVLLDAAKKMS